jgi:hypothetical protein
MTENDGWTSARIGQDLREGDEGAELQESPSPWWTPFIEDRKVLRGLLIMKNAYDREDMANSMGVDTREAPRRLEETELFGEIFRVSAGMSIDRALRQSDIDRQSAMVGLDQSSGAGGTSLLLDFVERIESGYIGYLFGEMGNGKTDFAVNVAELFSRIRSGDAEIGSNIQSFERAETIERYERLESWVQDESTEQLFIWDEASSSASGYSSDAHEVTDLFRRLLQSFRKHNSNLLMIGHTGKDIHPHIRRQCNDVIHKESKKRAAVYDRVDDGEPSGHRFTLEGIEATDWKYDTKEMSRWFWES